ncbi:MAG: glycosyltransferase [Phaeodactylibacter sp.]|nr:glycosyltransferase [Phaeodactylibacter sp.]MCB9274604.1 glycosyltransferase [Lewinellaceae bacterium]
MTSVIAYTALAIYTVALLYITVYCLMQFNLLYHYKKQKRREEVEKAQSLAFEASGVNTPRNKMVANAYHQKHIRGGQEDAEVGLMEVGDGLQAYPFVTVQLPIYNEMYVIERLIDCIAAFDYPKGRFEIHILDDSTDETVGIVARKVEEYKAKGLQIEQVRREKRQGYKAGALRDGMQYAQGEFIAIFDADFLPHPDFLLKTVPYFEDDSIGVVQTRWEHINEDYSLITRLQALQLNVHFTVEQAGRMAGNLMLQFNGTAGVWRRKTIEDAGGWEADTLTEDFDLSIRAQLKGWKIKYLEEIGSPAELPAEMNSFKSQQYRWMKGGAETAKKMLPTVWRSNLALWEKMQATVHLLASSIFAFVFIASVFSVPLLFSLKELINMGFSKNFFAYFLAGLLSIIAVYYVANVQAPVHKDEPFKKSLLRFVGLFPVFLALSMGLALHNTIAVLEGYRGKKTPFVRTPKFNIKNMRDSFTKSKYLKKDISWTTIFEGLLALYFFGAVIGGFYVQNTTFLVFHLMLALGYGTIFFITLRHLSLR